MFQSIINFSNLVAPFIASVGILYVSVWWVLIFFKKETLVNKYFTYDGESIASGVLFWIVAMVMLVGQLIVKLPPDELSPLGFTLIFGGSSFVVGFILIAIVKVLIKYRNTITPQ